MVDNLTLTQKVEGAPRHGYEIWHIDFGLFRINYYVDGQFQEEIIPPNAETALFLLQEFKKNVPDAEIVPNLRFGSYVPAELEALIKKIKNYDPQNPKPEDFSF